MTDPGPVTADDVDEVVGAAVLALGSRVDRDWRVGAAGLRWDCWETVEHVADDLFAYALQLSARRPPLTREVAVDYRARREGGPECTVFADPQASAADLVQVLDACGGLLTSLVRTAAPTVRAHHVFGVADPEGFAAMGIVEVLVHLNDVAPVLELDWVPAEDVCDRVLHRLFPEAPSGTGRWQALLWATGRAELPGRARVTSWRWQGEPRPAAGLTSGSTG